MPDLRYSLGYDFDEEESLFNQNDLSHSRDQTLRPVSPTDTNGFCRASGELYDPDDVFFGHPNDTLQPVRVNLNPDYSSGLLDPSLEGQTQQHGDNIYPNFVPLDPDIENEDVLQSSIALFSNELRSFGTPPAGSPSGKNPYGQDLDHDFRDDMQPEVEEVLIRELFEQSGLANEHDACQITLPSIADQLGDLNRIVGTAANGESTFSHSPPTRPPPLLSAVPSHTLGHLYFTNSHRRPSQSNGSLYTSLADYGYSNSATPSTDHSASTPPTTTIDIDGITNPQVGRFICNYPGCSAQPFQTQYLLNSHANVHSSNRPHYCSVKGCPRSEGGKGFKKKSEMIRHGLVHDSPGYVCPFCPDREHKYPRPDNLQRHVRVHHVDKDRDDPLLREVLSQRPEGPSRSRRRRGGDPTTLLDDIDADANQNDSIENFGENVQKSIIKPGRTCHIRVDEIGHPENNEEPEHDLQKFIAPATDSGYASIIQNKDECDEDKDDVQTARTDNQELIVREDVKENLASAFSSELVRDLERLLGNWGHIKLPRDTLQELFKEFSVRLRGRASPGQEKDATTFIRHYRNRISKIIEDSIAIASGELDKKDEDEEENPLKKQDGLSVAEKMSLWNLEYPENTNLEDTNLISSCDNNEDQDEDFSITNYPDAWRFITNGHEYQWLLGRLKGEILLTDRKNTLSESFRAGILEKLASKKAQQGYARNVSKAKFELSWDLPAYLRTQFPNETQVHISSIITIVGSGVNAQALTCADYMNQVWPTTGIEILNAVQEAISMGPEIPIRRFTPDKTRIDLHVQESAVLATVKGTEPAIAEIGQQLAWLGAALRPSPSDHQMVYSVPRMITSTGLVTTFQFSFHVIEVDPSLQRAERKGSCWRPLFKNPVIVKGYPILARFNDEKGLELPLNMMAGLGEACRVTNFLGGLLIKGFSTIFYPIQKIKGSVLWHCHSYHDGSRISYLTAGDAGTDRASVQDVDTACLMRSRNFLGWTSSAEIHAGSKSVDFNAIKWAGSNLASAGIVLEKLSIGAGHLITGGASFIKGDKDKPIYLSRDGPYEVQIHSAYNMKVVLYDVKDRRGFLMDGASALLHITRTQLSSSPYSESNHFKIEDFNHTEPSAGVLAAKQALMDSRNRNLVIFEKVEKSKEFQRNIDRVGEAENGKERRVIKPWTYEDLVLQTFHILEKIHDYHTKIVASSEFELRLPGRDKLLGFCFMDIVDGQNDLLPRVATLKSSGRAWVDFTNSIRAIPLLGKGFGEIIKPSKTSNKLCKRWRHVPTGKDYLVANIKTLEEICLRYGDYDSDPLEIADKIYWYKAHSSFENCEGKNSCAAGNCDKVQVLLPKRARSKKHPQPFDYQSGAVIFGKSKRFRWSFPSFGEPIEGGVSDSEPDEDNSLQDSGVGESIPSTSGIESSGNASSSPSGGSQPTSDREDYTMAGVILENEEVAASIFESILEPATMATPTIAANNNEQHMVPTLPFGRNSIQLGIPEIAVDRLKPPGVDMEPDVIGQAEPSQVLAHSDGRTKRALDKVIGMTSQMFPRKKLKSATFSNNPEHNRED